MAFAVGAMLLSITLSVLIYVVSNEFDRTLHVLGLTLASADNSSGLAVLDVPVSRTGIYTVQVINLSLGPVQVWTAATPNVKR